MIYKGHEISDELMDTYKQAAKDLFWNLSDEKATRRTLDAIHELETRLHIFSGLSATEINDLYEEIMKTVI